MTCFLGRDRSGRRGRGIKIIGLALGRWCCEGASSRSFRDSGAGLSRAASPLREVVVGSTRRITCSEPSLGWSHGSSGLDPSSLISVVTLALC